MKVWQLKRLNDAIKDLNYKSVFQFTEEDIDLLMKALDKNKDISTLMNFLMCEQQQPNWKEKFSHLEGIEEFDIKGYISNCILNATSKEKADLILEYFDCVYNGPNYNYRETLKLFKTVKEWCTYLNNIDVGLDHYIIQILNLVLKLPLVGNRSSSIKDVMSLIFENSQYYACDFFLRFIPRCLITDENKLYCIDLLTKMSLTFDARVTKMLELTRSSKVSEKNLKVPKQSKFDEITEQSAKEWIILRFGIPLPSMTISDSSCNSKMVPLSEMKVLELLEMGLSYDVALYGFNDEDEITSKTLSRSIPYIMYKK